MDIYRFVNSKDVRKFLKEINYEFNTLEAAYLIYFARGATLKEKHDAWQSLIDTMPDMAPKDYFDHFGWEHFGDSIHRCLCQHMENERRIIEEFEKVSSGAFFVQAKSMDGMEWNSTYFPMDSLFTNIDEVNEHMRSWIEFDEKDEICKFEIICKPEGVAWQYKIVKNRDGELLSVDVSAGFYPGPDLGWQLETMWFAFPTPFKKGDIVIDPARPDPSKLWAGPFVFEETAAEWLGKRGKAGHDYTDMTASGWFQDEDGRIYGEVMHDYMSLEYYPLQELEGVQRILIALSNHIKGELGGVDFSEAYAYYLAESTAKEIRSGFWTDRALRLLGFRVDD